MMTINAKDFARKYAGAEIKYTKEAPPFISTYEEHIGKTSKVIGFYNDDEYRLVAISFGCTSRDACHECYASRALKKLYYTLPYAQPERVCLIPVDLLQIYNAPAPSKPYPNICNLCSSPARKYNKLLLCSNDRCKTRKDVNRWAKQFDIYKAVDGSKLQPINLEHCFNCGGNIDMIEPYDPLSYCGRIYCERTGWHSYEFQAGLWYKVSLRDIKLLGFCSKNANDHEQIKYEFIE
jgi:hypothetical protein